MAKIYDISTGKEVEETKPEPLPETTGEVLANMIESPGLKAWLKGILKEKENESDRSS
jgi:hypothetical protein